MHLYFYLAWSFQIELLWHHDQIFVSHHLAAGSNSISYNLHLHTKTVREIGKATEPWWVKLYRGAQA